MGLRANRVTVYEWQFKTLALRDPPDELSLKLREANGLVVLPQGVRDLAVFASEHVPERGDGKTTWEL